MTRTAAPSTVADASPLIALAAIDQFTLLHALYGGIAIPPAVWDETVVRGRGRPGEAEVRSAPWIVQTPLRHPERVADIRARSSLDLGETEAILLAREIHAHLLLLDDLGARSYAKSAGLRIVGTLGVLAAARRRGLVGALPPLFDRLESVGFRFAKAAREEALRIAVKGGGK